MPCTAAHTDLLAAQIRRTVNAAFDSGLEYSVTQPQLISPHLRAHSSTPEGWEAELVQSAAMADYIPRWFTSPKTVTNPSTNGQM